MTEEQFGYQLRRLIEHFGAKNFPEEKLYVAWKRLGWLNYEELQAVVRECIANCQYAPTVDRMIDVGHKIIHAARDRRSLEEQHKIVEAEKCPICLNSWIHWAINRDGEKYFIHCDCSYKPYGWSSHWPGFQMWNAEIAKTHKKAPIQLDKEWVPNENQSFDDLVAIWKKTIKKSMNYWQSVDDDELPF